MITIEEIKVLISLGKVPMIYYSTSTLWWTHSAEDLAEATEAGHKLRSEQHKKFMEDPTIPLGKKKELDSIYKIANSSPHKMPMDPTGAMLYQMDKPGKWINEAENKPAHFGRHGLQAFMMAHHQNNRGQVAMTWETYNLMIDNEKYK